VDGHKLTLDIYVADPERRRTRQRAPSRKGWSLSGNRLDPRWRVGRRSKEGCPRPILSAWVRSRQHQLPAHEHRAVPGADPRLQSRDPVGTGACERVQLRRRPHRRVGRFRGRTPGSALELRGDAALEGAVGGNLDQSSKVQAVCDWFGPTDLVKLCRLAMSAGTNDGTKTTITHPPRLPDLRHPRRRRHRTSSAALGGEIDDKHDQERRTACHQGDADSPTSPHQACHQFRRRRACGRGPVSSPSWVAEIREPGRWRDRRLCAVVVPADIASLQSFTRSVGPNQSHTACTFDD